VESLISVGLGVVGLFFGGEWLVKGASRLATSLGIPSFIIGLTIVSLGTSAPELVVSLSAALGGSSDVALGNVVGSNIANVGLILGLSGIIYPLLIHGQMVRREIPIMIAVSVIVFLFALDRQIDQFEGFLLVMGYVAFTVLLYRFTPQTPDEKAEVAEIRAEVEAIEGIKPPSPLVVIDPKRESLRFVVGLILLIVGAQLTVDGAISIARTVGVSELIIGLTVVAVGTSLPEVVTSVVASIRKHSDLAVGNVVGSNIANLLVILGFTAMIKPIPVADTLISFELPVMMAFAVGIVPFVLDLELERWQAFCFLVAYFGFIVLTIS
jgi:cation:H+ antiporter